MTILFRSGQGWIRAVDHAEWELVTLQGWTCAWRGESLVPRQLIRLPAMLLAQVALGLLILGGGLGGCVCEGSLQPEQCF